MFEILAVTDRRLCGENFLRQLKAVAASGIDGLCLREKDLSPEDYESLALEVSGLCRRSGTDFIAHQFCAAAKNTGARRIHLPLRVLEGLGDLRAELLGVRTGVSIHSLEEGRRALAKGADYLIAGHIFRTQSKEGLEGRGLAFLEEICRGIPLPVYAIGGITEENIRAVYEAGAAGVCILSPFMGSPDPGALAAGLRMSQRTPQRPVSS